MNHDTSPQPVPGANDAVQAAIRFIRVARRHKAHLAGCLLIAAAIGSFYFVTADRLYEAKAELLVERSHAELLGATQTIHSDAKALVANHEALIRQPKVLAQAAKKVRSLPAELTADFRGLPIEQWADRIDHNLATRNLNKSNIIQVTFRASSARAAEAILAEVVSAYFEFVDEHHQDTSGELLSTLDRVRSEVEDKLTEAQNHLLEIRRETRILGIERNGSVVPPAVARALNLNDTLIEVQKGRIELESALTSIQDAIAKGGNLGQHLYLIEPTVGRDLISGALGVSPEYAAAAGQLERQLLQDRAQLESLQLHLGPNNPRIVQLQKAISETELHLAGHQSRLQERMNQLSGDGLGPILLSMVQEKLIKTRAHERELLQQFKESEAEAVALNEGMAELMIAERELERHQRLHETLLTQIAGLDIGRNQGGVLVSITGEARASNQPVTPRLGLVALLSLLGGLSSGCGLVFLIDVLDDRFRTPDDLQQQLSIPLLAVVGQLPDEVASAGADESPFLADRLAGKPETEAFRTLRTSLLLGGNENRRIAVSSTEPADGKTTLLSNLAVSLAQAGRRVLMIDADLRKPGLSNFLEVRGCPGLTTALQSDAPLDDVMPQYIIGAGRPLLSVLPCGPKPQDPAELLSRHRFAALLEWCESHFDHVLIDCPPAMVASDASIVGRVADGLLLVVQPQKNPRKAVLRSAETLRAMGVAIVGVIANRVQAENGSGYHEFGYGYGYGYGYGEKEEELTAAPAAPAELHPAAMPPLHPAAVVQSPPASAAVSAQPSFTPSVFPPAADGATADGATADGATEQPEYTAPEVARVDAAVEGAPVNVAPPHVSLVPPVAPASRVSPMRRATAPRRAA